MIKRNRWSKKQAQRQSNRASEELRRTYLEVIGRYEPEDLIFLDESIFNEKTGWRRRHYHYLRPNFRTFGDFLTAAIERSRCDRFARKQFRHAAGGVYCAKEDIDRIRAELEAYERGETDNWVEA
ncbi:uncharacterized protein BDZ99DRAFT_518572 [Mytilinidion resinicola]|uniref:Tc1-like transposase DDE domain-containing protein n=1 Tax=Mytilinidion resinicola TaxID=574789 RepID=A0A6A6YW66_9PEZI|nr:uncharacterized protein BDZ99DRAFT_518572 [Mytilinidion resinicola]KAF2812759.1 hypothetical protein BDZ99DRAFT_518572 [Mytilinidion resinicola]